MPAQPYNPINTRATLLARLQNLQDQASWQVFFDIYWKLIYGVARQAGLADVEAEDVVQETMVSVAKHIPTFKYDPSVGSFKAWLLTMTRWRILDQVRKRLPVQVPWPSSSGTATGTNIVDKLVDPASQQLDKVWDVEWERTLLEAAIDRVKRRVDPEKYQIFDFYVNKEWKAEKVATTFGVTVDHVYLAKHRITEMIKEEVKRLEKETT